MGRASDGDGAGCAAGAVVARAGSHGGVIGSGPCGSRLGGDAFSTRNAAVNVDLVAPAKAGAQAADAGSLPLLRRTRSLGPGLRRDDGKESFRSARGKSIAAKAAPTLQKPCAASSSMRRACPAPR